MQKLLSNNVLFKSGKKALLSLAFLISISTNSFAQHPDLTWMMGYYSPVYMGLKFHGGVLDSFQVNRNMSFFLTSASICDANGDLLFYTNGDYIENRFYQRLDNSTNFNPSLTNDSVRGLNIEGGAIIIPHPGNVNQYYLFHLNAEYYTLNNQIFAKPMALWYSIIDMQLDNGNGGILPNKKTVTIINDTVAVGRLAAVKHANGRDWWVLSHRYKGDEYFKLLVTPDTIQQFSQSIGYSIVDSLDPSALTKFTNDGNKLAALQRDSIIALYDFDRCTGLLSNYYQVYFPVDSFNILPLGFAFSRSGRFLYVCNWVKVLQYDLTATDINSSRIEVAALDSFMAFNTRLYFFTMKLALDGKIYIDTFNGTNYLHVINNPDVQGLGCNLVQHQLSFSAWNFGCFPNNPNYDLGPVTGSACDTVLSANETLANSLRIYPQPANDFVFINGEIARAGVITLYDVTGRKIREHSFSELPIKEDIESLPKGIYSITVTSKQGVFSGKVIKQ